MSDFIDIKENVNLTSTAQKILKSFMKSMYTDHNFKKLPENLKDTVCAPFGIVFFQSKTIPVIFGTWFLVDTDCSKNWQRKFSKINFLFIFCLNLF